MLGPMTPQMNACLLRLMAAGVITRAQARAALDVAFAMWARNGRPAGGLTEAMW
jgi:hypothetical protein